MFGFRTRSGYQSIDEEALLHPSTLLSEQTSERRAAQAKWPRIWPGVGGLSAELLMGNFRDEGRHSDVYGGPPLEHGIPANEPGEADDCHAANVTVKWDGIEDLDQFFTRVYEYHQYGGYVCIVVKHVLTLLQFIFVIWFVTFLRTRVDYGVLFRSKNVTEGGRPVSGKIRLSDVIYPDWTSHMDYFTVFLLTFAILFWVFRAVRVACQISHFKEIRRFYRLALRIEDSSLGNLKWREVVQLICEKQPSIHLILTKDGITALDLYQRILRYKASILSVSFFALLQIQLRLYSITAFARLEITSYKRLFQNYFVALVNKEILPPVIDVPFIGSMPYLPNGLKMNVEWLLFYGKWSPWNGMYEIKEEYKHHQNVYGLAKRLERIITYMAVGNFVFFPVVFFYQVLYFFFTYGELLKRDPSSFAIRRYSNYGRNKLRHFNELDHELRMRLSRSHRAATQYMEQFVSPLGQVIARKVQFVAGAICIVLLVLGLWDEDVLTVEHVLTIISVSGLIAVVCRTFIADENMIYWPETLLNMVVAQIHYAPDSWRGKAHTDAVRREFGQLFQLKAQFLLEELLSPILTPFILFFWIRPKAKEIVDFFHHFTVSVEGLGDVCSFAQMDIRRHGDAAWSFNEHTEEEVAASRERISANDGKTELSLIYFASNHPEWKPPLRAARFLDDMRERMRHDMAALKEGDLDENALLNSLHSIQAIPFEQLQQHRNTDGTQSLIASLYDHDLHTAPQMSLYRRGRDFADMDTETQSMVLSVAYLRSLHAQCDSQHQEVSQVVLEIPRASLLAQAPDTEAFGSGAATAADTVGDVWSVPAQSAILPHPNVLPSESGSEQHEENNDESPPPMLIGLSDKFPGI
ncbi:unnamed protein product [Gongylonema pulchrum]|uniref:Autophagy-related protein 9 n=2 Tax=Gongylonema pulchrum TaxID=637853 RepID=A0A183DRW5_9BILA|nr:unnamed protein product [Gongylonema pulchrum]